MFKSDLLKMAHEKTNLLSRLIEAEGANGEGSKDRELLQVLDSVSEIVVTREVLAATGIGKQVTRLKKRKNEEIRKLAEELLTEWKRDMETRSKVVDRFIRHGISKRQAAELEEGLFNSACPLGFLQGLSHKEYIRHCTRLSEHLRSQDEGSLRQRLENGQLQPNQVAFLPNSQLLSAKRQRALEFDMQDSLQAAVLAEKMEGTETQEYMCPKCRSTRTAYREVQTGWHNDHQDLTILVTCLQCGERWKANDDHGLAGS